MHFRIWFLNRMNRQMHDVRLTHFVHDVTLCRGWSNENRASAIRISDLTSLSNRILKIRQKAKLLLVETRIPDREDALRGIRILFCLFRSQREDRGTGRV